MVCVYPYLVGLSLTGNSSKETATAALETLVSLVNQPEGAKVFVAIQDLTPLTEMAPSQPLVLDILLHAWLNAMSEAGNKGGLRSAIDKTIGDLVSSFKGTDGVTLLAFLASLLPQLEPEVCLSSPKPACG